MPNKKITGMTELTEAAAADLLEIVDVSEPDPALKNKKIRKDNLIQDDLDSLTELTTPAAEDILKIFDTDADEGKKITYANLTAGLGGGGGADPSEIILTDTYANRPAAGTEGRLFLPTNSVFIERDDGSAWQSFGPVFPFVAPVDGDFAWINQNDASVSTTKGGIYLDVPTTVNNNWRMRVKSAPATPYVLTTAFISKSLNNSDEDRMAIIWRQSSDGKIITNSYHRNGTGLKWQLTKWDSPTAFSAHYLDISVTHPLHPTFIRLADDGANRKVSISMDGQNWLEIHSVGRTDYLTADQIGFGIHTTSSSRAAGMWLLSWSET